MQLCCGPGDETVVSGGYDQAVRVWDMRSRSFDPVQTLKPFADSVTAVLVTQRCAIPMRLLMLSTCTLCCSARQKYCCNLPPVVCGLGRDSRLIPNFAMLSTEQ